MKLKEGEKKRTGANENENAKKEKKKGGKDRDG